MREKLRQVKYRRAFEAFKRLFGKAVFFEHLRLFGRVFFRPGTEIEHGRVEIDFIDVFGIKKRVIESVKPAAAEPEKARLLQSGNLLKRSI